LQAQFSGERKRFVGAQCELEGVLRKHHMRHVESVSASSFDVLLDQDKRMKAGFRDACHFEDSCSQ
jgi:hypothetical protein